MSEPIASDYLIIGSGIAGLSLAIKLAQLGSVTVLSKRDFLDSNTSNAQGGIAAVVSKDDSFEQHTQDTLRAGAGLCHEDVVRLVVEAGPSCIEELAKWGMVFSRAAYYPSDESLGDGPKRGRNTEHPYELGLEGGHSRRRILHAGDYTGSEIAKTLLKQAQLCANIRLLDHQVAVDLITTGKLGKSPQPGEISCLGAYVLDKKTGLVGTFTANKAVILATGGAGKVYLYTSNPDVAMGDGMAMAYRSGAVMANMEFVQFHPTCLYHPQAKSFLISEAVRGEGGILRRRNGESFMRQYHPAGELAPRDIVARAIDSELKKWGEPYVYLDIRHKGKEFLKKRFPMIYSQTLKFGIDMSKDMIPVVPAAHYFCGGVKTDADGRTSISRLWAIGEVACTGLHGANRLASNSLLEGMVFAHRACEAIKAEGLVTTGPSNAMSKALESKPQPLLGTRASELGPQVVPPWNPGKARNPDELVVISQNWDEIRQLMWNYVGIVRSDKRLARAIRRIEVLQQEIQEYYWDFIVSSDLIELRNIATVAELVIRSAMMRQESRGLHYNLDHPNTDTTHPPTDTLLQRPA
jgi:L-aspartate oxidase